MKRESHRFVFVVITHKDARIWRDGIEPGALPYVVLPPDPDRPHHHVRQGQHHGGHRRDRNEPEYFEEIEKLIADAAEILVLGNATGRSNAMTHLMKYLEEKNPALAHKVISLREVSMSAMTEGELLAFARHWYSQHVHPHAQS